MSPGKWAVYYGGVFWYAGVIPGHAENRHQPFDTWPEALCYALARAEGYGRAAAVGKAWGRKGRAA